MRVTVHRTGWRRAGSDRGARGGNVVVLPLGRGQAADLEIELGPGVSRSAALGRRGKRVHATR